MSWKKADVNWHERKWKEDQLSQGRWAKVTQHKRDLFPTDLRRVSKQLEKIPFPIQNLIQPHVVINDQKTFLWHFITWINVQFPVK